MKRLIRNSKGQFYLISAIILVTIIVALVSITNYSGKNDNERIQNLGKELGIEIEKVLDYDEINSQNRIENFTEEYSNFIGDDIDAYFVTGDKDGMEAYTFENDVKVDLSSEVSVVSDEILFVHDEVEYSFKLNQGKNFYFVLSQNIGDENYVYTN